MAEALKETVENDESSHVLGEFVEEAADDEAEDDVAEEA